MRNLKVTAAVLKKEGKYLIAKRKQNDILGGLWEFPRGKIEEGETAEECLKREIKEELNIIVEVNELILSKNHKYSKGYFELIAFKVKYISGEIILNEHDDYKWVPYEKLAMFNFLLADIPIIDKIKNNDRL